MNALPTSCQRENMQSLAGFVLSEKRMFANLRKPHATSRPETSPLRRRGVRLQGKVIPFSMDHKTIPFWNNECLINPLSPTEPSYVLVGTKAT